MGDVRRLSPEAREYGARELMRRACGDDFERQCAVEVLPAETRVRVAGGAGVEVIYPNAPEEGLALEGVRRFGWPAVREEARISAIPDFIAPHISGPAGGDTPPLFRIEGRTRIVAGGDLLGSVVAALSRLEEAGGAGRDGHQRMPARESLAWKHGFLDRPVVDELACGLEVCVRKALPGWTRRPRRLHARVSHDVDVAGLPFGKRLALQFTTVRRRPLWTLREVGSGLGIALPCHLKWLEELVRVVRSMDVDSSVYWMAAAPSDRDAGYDPAHPFVRATIERCREAGADIGYHASYYAYSSPELIEREVARLRDGTGRHIAGGRHHYLRWSPDMWSHWERAGLGYDSSVGYADCIGFRAGTCVPYRPWSERENRALELVELPLIAMDGTLVSHMKLGAAEVERRVGGLIDKCRWADGVFTLLWHNTSVHDERYAGLLPGILGKLRGADSCRLPR